VDGFQVALEVRVGHEEKVACGTGERSGAIVDPEVFLQEALVVEEEVADVTEVDVDGVVRGRVVFYDFTFLVERFGAASTLVGVFRNDVSFSNDVNFSNDF
jgi:hypothetical protein